MTSKITVVVSKGQSKNPKKLQLEDDIASELASDSDVDVLVLPHLYDLPAKADALTLLMGVQTDLVVCSWLFPRAAHWTLDRFGVRGSIGDTLLRDEDEDEDNEEESDGEKQRVLDTRENESRVIYCLDLRVSDNASEFVDEARRITREVAERDAAKAAAHSSDAGSATHNLLDWIKGQPDPGQLERFLNPANSTPLGGSAAHDGNPRGNGQTDSGSSGNSDADKAKQASEPAGRRWYPVIDFSRCTNCMECIDFCLFGVYGVDGAETILVEQPDNCRKGCPACSRVCPENAIIFPQHKTPAIAGSMEAAGSLKIDLSKLFGAPDEGKSAAELAAAERDEQLILAGREAVGMDAAIPKRQAERDRSEKDDLDSLIDELDDLDV